MQELNKKTTQISTNSENLNKENNDKEKYKDHLWKPNDI